MRDFFRDFVLILVLGKFRLFEDFMGESLKMIGGFFGVQQVVFCLLIGILGVVGCLCSLFSFCVAWMLLVVGLFIRVIVVVEEVVDVQL